MTDKRMTDKQKKQPKKSAAAMAFIFALSAICSVLFCSCSVAVAAAPKKAAQNASQKGTQPKEAVFGAPVQSGSNVQNQNIQSQTQLQQNMQPAAASPVQNQNGQFTLPLDAIEEQFYKTYGKLQTKVKLRPGDQKAAQIAKNFINNTKTPMPSAGRNGSVQLQFGSTLPRILCRPLRVTDIELEPGENIVNTPFVGDSVNWSILPSTSGAGDNLTYHIIVKPTMPDLNTNLIVHTDKRTYQLDLVSSNQYHTPHVTFVYPDSNNDNWDSFFAAMGTNDPRRRSAKQEEEVFGTPLPAGRPGDNMQYSNRHGRKRGTRATAPIVAMPQQSENLNLNYTVLPKKKGIDWVPLRVYDDGLKTYIDMPDNLASIEAPVFMILSPAGSREMVNYRLVDRTYVIDRLIKRGVLITGTGREAEEVVISRMTNDELKQKRLAAEAAIPQTPVLSKNDLINYLKGGTITLNDIY